MRPKSFTFGIALLAGGLSIVRPAAVMTTGVSRNQNPSLQVVRGRVVDGVSTRPISGASVALTGSAGLKRQSVSDPLGAFEFARLPPGTYSVSVMRSGYFNGAFGQKVPDGPSATLVLDQTSTKDIVLRLWQYATVEGTVRDEANEGMVALKVALLRSEFVGGTLQLTRVASTVTDDQGHYRFGALKAGKYFVGVFPTISTIAGEALRDHPALAGRTQPLSTAAIMARDGQLIAEHSSGAVTSYRPMLYPNAASVQDASPLALAYGMVANGIDFQVRFEPSRSVVGTLVDPDDKPVQFAWVSLVPKGLHDAGLIEGLELARGLTDDDGHFSFIGVHPGDYVIRSTRVPLPRDNSARRREMAVGSMVDEGGDRRSGVPMPPPDTPTLWVAEDLRIESDREKTIKIRMRPGVQVAGRLEFESERKPSHAELERIVVVLEPVDGRDAANSYRGPLNPFAATFLTYGAPPGKYLIQVNGLPAGWHSKSALLRGTDHLDSALTLTESGKSGLQLIIAQSVPPPLVGTVRTTDGLLAGGAFVMIFPTDKTYWSDFGASPRRLRAARVNNEGNYQIPGLPDGEYFLLAVSEQLETADWREPQTLERLSKSATRVTLTGAGPRMSDLQVNTSR